MKLATVCAAMTARAHACDCVQEGLFKEQWRSPRGSSKHAASAAALTVKLKSVPLCVCVNDPGGTPAPAVLHTFSFTCLLCLGCGPVREDYSEECSRAHLLKQETRGGHGHKVYVH